MQKGSCHKIPCNNPKDCQCKTICVNCCDGQKDCYMIAHYKLRTWKEIKPQQGTQLTLFNNTN